MRPLHVEYLAALAMPLHADEVHVLTEWQIPDLLDIVSAVDLAVAMLGIAICAVGSYQQVQIIDQADGG